MGNSWLFPTSLCPCNMFESAGSVAAFEDIGDSESDVIVKQHEKNGIEISFFYIVIIL